MKKIVTQVLFLLSLALFFVTCTKDGSKPEILQPELPEQVYDYSTENFSDQMNFMEDRTPSDNQITDHGATLGRVLFYETGMSLNNTVSCGTCHKQSFAFADNKKASTGIEGKQTPRNSMALFNHRFSPAFFWDLRETVLEEQVLKPIENHVEMGLERTEDLIPKLQKIDYYPALFEAAFGSPEITSDRISKALAQFLRSMTSFNSKYDKGEPDNFANFNSNELEGMALLDEFRCTNCHGIPTFSDHWSESGQNIGLDMNYSDAGMGEWTGERFREGSFKVPPLRNIAVTQPYMHDGRFQTLREVLDFYSNKIQSHPNLTIVLSEGGWNGGSGSNTAVKMNMTEHEKDAIIAFLNTLTDESFMNDPKFSNPFKQ